MSDEPKTLHTSGKAADHDGATRQQILQAAQTLFLERGYKGVAMRDIADAVHISQAALYYHFPHGKDELLFSMMDGMFSYWNNQLQQVIAQGGPLHSKLEFIARNFFSTPFDRMMVLLRDIHTVVPESAGRDALHQRMTAIQHQYSAIFQEAMDAGEIRSDLPASYLAQLFGGMLFGAMRYAMTDKTVAGSPSEKAETVIGVLLNGIASQT
jgi:AcrR family transcriptional regulator